MEKDVFFSNTEEALIHLMSTCVGLLTTHAGIVDPIPQVCFEITKDKKYGDRATNISMLLSKIVKRSPREIGQKLRELFLDCLKEQGLGQYIEKMEIAGAGFLNVFFSKEFFIDQIKYIIKQDRVYGITNRYAKEKILIEFVSANPTGPLSIAHARQAAIGDALAAIFTATGASVTKEYYLNDEGNQIRILGLSVLLRYKELLGEKIEFPEDCYRGGYIVDIARDVLQKYGSTYHNAHISEEESIQFFSDFAQTAILADIKKDLNDFGVSFDTWFSQRSLSVNKLIEQALGDLKEKKLLYEQDGAVWFKSTDFGDDKDRVLIKSDGSETYLTPDIAYHREKYRRGYGKIINLWGPDHHGYIARVKAAVEALGFDPKKLHILIIQLTTLYQGDVQVKMSTRAGQLVTLRQLLDEIGRDTSRFFLLSRKGESHLDFDLALAKSATPENPVYYVQYAHARICNILVNAKEKGIMLSHPEESLSLIKEEEELDLMRALSQYPTILQVCQDQLDPCRLTVYLRDLAATFHGFYAKHRVLSEDIQLSLARLMLVNSTRIVLHNGLGMLGISAPEKM